MKSRNDEAPTRVAVTGAAGGFARTLLPQLVSAPDLCVTVLCDSDLPSLQRVCEEVGLSGDLRRVCGGPEEVLVSSAAGGTALVGSSGQIPPASYDVLVEATGHPQAGYEAASAGAAAGKGIVMATKETQAAAGRQLLQEAEAAGGVVIPAEGDQPANLLDLMAWARECGLDVLAAGKAGEYDLVVDGGQVHYDGISQSCPELVLRSQGRASLSELVRRRGEALSGFRRRSAADVCEMAVAGDLLGLPLDDEALHYPALHQSELADAYAPAAEGGILREEGTLDVFTCLRSMQEVSAAGGVFVVVALPDRGTAEVLRAKGHIISRDGRRAAIIRPYHLMGLESLRSVRKAARREFRARPEGAVLTMYGAARERLDQGDELVVAGHHHEIAGVEPRASRTPPEGAVPFYVLNGARLLRTVAPGEPIRAEDVSIPPSSLAEACGLSPWVSAYQEGAKR